MIDGNGTDSDSRGDTRGRGRRTHKKTLEDGKEDRQAHDHPGESSLSGSESTIDVPRILDTLDTIDGFLDRAVKMRRKIDRILK